MQKKVLEDIHAPDPDTLGDRPGRKWNYGGGVGITKNDQEEELSESEQHMNTTVEKEEIESAPSVSHYGSGDRVFPKKPSGTRKISPLWWGAAGVGTALLIFVFVWSFLSTATVRVVLSQQTTTINDTFTAVRTAGEDGVPYQIVKLQEKETIDLAPSGEENVVRKATGQIVVYNEDATALKLIVNTRFQTPDGKIYRIDKAVNVPAAKKDVDGKAIPGSVETTVFADEPGAAYNIALVDFKLPGLSGTDLFDKIYARSKTEMSGGFTGVLKSASAEELENASKTLREKVQAKLLANISGQIDENSILYNGVVFTDFSTHVPTEVSANGMLTIEETGIAQAFVFDRRGLSSALAKRSISSYDGSPVIVKNLDELTFVFENKDTFDINVPASFTFTLTGNPHTVWEIDAVAFKNDLAGLSKNDISSIIKKYSSVRKVEANIKPFWKSTFPNNPDAITIEEVLE